MDESFKMVKYCFKVQKPMNRLTIPSILAATVLVAGIFAFMPIEKASTVHTTIQANTARLSESTVSVTDEDDDFTVTCPTGSNGCHILEMYLDDDSTAVVDTDAITCSCNGETVTLAADTDNEGSGTAGDVFTVLLNGVSGVAIGEGDVITVGVTGGTLNVGDYNLTVIASVEGGLSISVAAVAN